MGAPLRHRPLQPRRAHPDPLRGPRVAGHRHARRVRLVHGRHPLWRRGRIRRRRGGRGDDAHHRRLPLHSPRAAAHRRARALVAAAARGAGAAHRPHRMVRRRAPRARPGDGAPPAGIRGRRAFARRPPGGHRLAPHHSQRTLPRGRRRRARRGQRDHPRGGALLSRHRRARADSQLGHDVPGRRRAVRVHVVGGDLSRCGDRGHRAGVQRAGRRLARRARSASASRTSPPSTRRSVLMAEPLLAIENLRTYFYTTAGVARAVDGLSLRPSRRARPWASWASRAAESRSPRSRILRLVAPPGRIETGSAHRVRGPRPAGARRARHARPFAATASRWCSRSR